jgi:hypothetical protein
MRRADRSAIRQPSRTFGSARPLVVREVRAMKDDHDGAEPIIAWLRDTNAIQRNVVKTAAGKTDVVAEHDLSGGLTVLLNLLRSSAPIPAVSAMRSRSTPTAARSCS